ncbi:MAG: peroxidase, partial [Mycobacteriaceae bacterium]|nr:peroxidase [Mycobacteriaceae bacterium]
PDEVAFYNVRGERALRTPLRFMDLAMGQGRPEQPRGVLEDVGYDNAFYSLGIASPGAITLHNYPTFFQPLTRVNGDTFDLGAVDILRARECEIARYNDFRRFFRLRPARSFYDITGNDEAAAEIRQVYEGNLEAVDLMVGLFAEPKPEGFAFSDTAFRVFLLMAARRLTSDRFFTTDFTPQVYTEAGLKWIAGTTFADMLRRHYPELRPVMKGVDNAFQPWEPVPS